MSRERFTRAYYRSPKLGCGCHAPCRCEHRNQPSEKRTDAYKDAIEYLAGQGFAGVKIDFETGAEAVNAFYSLHCQTRRKHGLPPQPFSVT